MAEPMEESSLEAQLAAAVQENQAFRASQQELADRHASEMAEVRGQMAALVSQAAAQAEHFQAQMAHAQQAGAVPQMPVAPVDQPQPPPRSTVQDTWLPKPNKPDTFSGKESELVKVWLFQMEQYFELCNVDPTRRVIFAASQLRGYAAAWWETCVEDCHADQTLLAPLYQWGNFRAALTQNFDVVNQAEAARDAWAVLQQKRSVKEYTNEFRRLCFLIPDASAAAKKDRFLRGLKSTVRRIVVQKEPIGSLTLETIEQLAERIDTVEFQARRWTGSAGDQGSNRKRGQGSYGRQANPLVPARQALPVAQDGPVPMELGALPQGRGGGRFWRPSGRWPWSRHRRSWPRAGSRR